MEVDLDVLTNSIYLLFAVDVEGPVVVLGLVGQTCAVLRNEPCRLRGQPPGNRAEVFVFICPLVAPNSLGPFVSESQPRLAEIVLFQRIMKLEIYAINYQLTRRFLLFVWLTIL